MRDLSCPVILPPEGETVNIVMNLVGRLLVADRHAREQREAILRQKRERFLDIQKSDTPPPELLAPPPRRLRRNELQIALLVVCASFAALWGIAIFAATVIPVFRSIATRERETQAWVQQLTAKPPVDMREARFQQHANEMSALERETARDLRRLTALAAIPLVMSFFVFPSLLIWLLLRRCYVLRNGVCARAELMSRKLWTSYARLSFATVEGKQFTAVQPIPAWVPIGAKLWVVYARRNPTNAVVFGNPALRQ